MSRPYELVFEPDELVLIDVKPEWIEEDILQMEGMFLFKEIIQLLKIDRKRLHYAVARREDPYGEMGVKKVMGTWFIRMKVFKTYYLNSTAYRRRPVDPSWDVNVLLAQKEWFYLTDVGKLFPFTRLVRERARNCENPKEEMGCWRDDDFKGYVVDMEIFARWFKKQWKESKSK